MKASKTLLLILATTLLCCLFFWGCKPQNPEFREIRNMKIEKLGLSSSRVSLEVVMYNPNNFGVGLTESNLDIYIDNRFLGKATSQSEIMIPKKSAFAVPVSAEINNKNLLANSLNVLLSKEVDVNARGRMRIKKAGISKNIDVDYKGRHKIKVSDLF